MEKGSQDLTEPLVGKDAAGSSSSSAKSVAIDAAAALLASKPRPPMLGSAKAPRKSSACDLLKAILNDPGTERYRTGAKYKYTMRVALNVRELRKMLLAPVRKSSESKQAYATRAAQWGELQRAHHAKHLYPLPSILNVGVKKVLVCALLILCATSVAHVHAPGVEKERARVEKKEREERLCVAHMECARLAITSGWGAESRCCPDPTGEVLGCCDPPEEDDGEEPEDPEEPEEPENEEGHGGSDEHGGGGKEEGHGGKHEGGGGDGGHTRTMRRRRLRGPSEEPEEERRAAGRRRRRLGEEAHGGGGHDGEHGGGGHGGEHGEGHGGKGEGEGGGGDEEAEETTPWKDSQSSTFIVIFLIVLTLVFEAGKETLEEETPREMRGVLTQIFAEFTVLGFLAMMTYFLIKFNALSMLSEVVYGAMREREAPRAHPRTHAVLTSPRLASPPSLPRHSPKTPTTQPHHHHHHHLTTTTLAPPYLQVRRSTWWSSSSASTSTSSS